MSTTTTMTIPAVIKSLFNTFPLYLLPPTELPPLPQTLPERQTLLEPYAAAEQSAKERDGGGEETAPTGGEDEGSMPRLYVLLSDPDSQSTHMYLLLRQIQHLVVLTNRDSHTTHPFIVTRSRTSTTTSHLHDHDEEVSLMDAPDSILAYIESRGPSIEVSRVQKDNVLAFRALFEGPIRDAYVLASSTSSSSFFPLLPMTSSSKDTRKSATRRKKDEWMDVLQEAETAWDAINVYLGHHAWLCRTLGCTFVDALLFGYANAILSLPANDTLRPRQQFGRMAQLKKVVEKCGNVVRQRNRLLDSPAGKKLAF